MGTWHKKTTDVAKGQWKGILSEIGIPPAMLTGRHCACPLCGGEDRFRFDNSEGRGTWICNACGAGDGMGLAMKFAGKTYPEMAAHIDTLLGNKKFSPDQIKPDMSEEQRKAKLRETALLTRKIMAGDLVDRYLHLRGLGDTAYPKALRCAMQLPDGEGAVRPAMVATVQDMDGMNVTLHRTFLRPDGHAKAEMECPRKLMPGPLPKGSAVRLGEFYGGTLGIAEGIETAMSAARLFRVPVWAALNAGNMAHWLPPSNCEDVAIFGDNDRNFAGHSAAYQLAHRLASRGINVTVSFPYAEGMDFNDQLLTKKTAA